MTSAVLVDIRDEVTCPICLELLTEPLSIDCGHSFCQACITGNSDKSLPNPEGRNSCPVCRTTYQPGNLRPNRHLAAIVKRLREVVLGPRKQIEVILCALHGEKLQLFCKEDGKLICWLCERSQEHHGHHTFLMEEVAKDYQLWFEVELEGKEMFQESLKKLKKEQQEAERLKALIREKRESWKGQVEPERHRIQNEFKQLRTILDREEQRELKKLEVEERRGLSLIEKAEGDLIHQSQSLKDLISDLEHRCQGSTIELLQDVSDVTKRSEFWTLRKPQALPTKLKSLFRAPDLKKMLRVFRELTDVQSYWVDVTLNPQTANLNLVLSKNRRQVRFVGAKLSEPTCLEEHYDCSVLGSQHFSSGKYYWEVDVTKKTAWILGVCSNPVEPMFSFNQYPSQQSAFSRYQPQSGYWVIGLQHKHEYRAYEDSNTSLLLSMTVPPRRIGVFLDYEAGTVSFYNVTNHGLPIYTFSKCTFGLEWTCQVNTVSYPEKAICPVCHELLKEPLSLGCGHSVCHACITMKKKNTVANPRGRSNCPVCGSRFSFESLQANNQHLADTVERLKEVKLNPDIGKKTDLCIDHGEKLLLFCKEDRKVICWVCERSREHRGHHTFLQEEAVKECQENLQKALKRLREEQKKAEELEANIKEDRISWKCQIQTERQRIQTGFNQLRRILEEEEQRELKRLGEEEQLILNSLAEAEAELAQQSHLVEELISDLERRFQWSATELLQDMSGILKWSQIWTLKKPKVVSKKLKKVFQAPDLSDMLQKFRERKLTAVRGYWVDFTFNPENLNLNLILSEDHRQVTPVAIWPFKCYNNGILGSKCFSSGKHYWEVDVSKKNAWTLGVYTRKRALKFDVRQGKNQPNVYHRYKPKNGYWVIGLRDGSKYSIFEDSSNCDPTVLTPFVAVPLHRVGVFLDCEEGVVSFFNVTNHGSPIYTFSRCCFSKPAYPYFNPWDCPAPMTLCLLNS
ncbi:tripartite motif-containing protein 6 [Sigmodon hispidus]